MAVDRKLVAKNMAKPKVVALSAGKESHGGFDIYPGGRAVWNAKVGELPHDPKYRDQYSLQTEYTGGISHANRSSREVTKAAGISETGMMIAAPAITVGTLASTIFGRGARGKLKASRIGVYATATGSFRRRPTMRRAIRGIIRTSNSSRSSSPASPSSRPVTRAICRHTGAS